VCESNEKYEFELERHGKDEIYTCARLALLPVAETLDICATVTLISQNCLMECGVCDLKKMQCRNSDRPIVGFKDNKKTCKWISNQRTKKITKFCKNSENVLTNCPITCDACVSNAPTDGYVCEDSTFKFTVDGIFVKQTCESLDDKFGFNANVITGFCTASPEIKAMCPALCDNCLSGSPSSEPECNDNDDKKKAKCKRLRKKSESKIASKCLASKVKAKYCRATCNTCED